MNTSSQALATLERTRAAAAALPEVLRAATPGGEALSVAAIEALYRECGATVRRRARALLGCEAAAEDALQDVFLKALDHREEFRASASPRTWLYRVTLNHCLNVKRDARRRQALLAMKVQPAQIVAPACAEVQVEARRLLGRVGGEVRAAAGCFYVEGLTQDEAAAALGVSRRTVGNRLRALRDAAGVG